MAGDSGAVDSTYGGEVGPAPVPVSGARRGLTIRLRMTIAYGAAAFVTGAVLIYTAYSLFRWRLAHMNQDLADPPGCPEPNPKKFPVQAAYCNSVKNKEILSQIDKPLIIVLLISAVVAVLIGYFLAGRFLRPINQITRTARRVASRPDRALHARIDMEGPQDDELVHLAQTFDGMLDRLDLAFEGQRRFVGNASHELRTPLAINRTLLEVTLMDPEASEQTRQLCRTLLSTNERSERMIEGLLLLAKADNEPTNREDIDLAEVAYRSVTQCEMEAAERHVAIRTSLQSVDVSGDGILIERIAMNLIQNALRHNIGAGGWVDVLSYDRSHDLPGHGLLVVANTGPEVPPYAVETLFEPFKRGTQPSGASAARDPKDKGVGLGLSIVRSVVRAHGGRVAAEPRPGGGLIVRVWLPVRV
ncbi:sensor histidine kinase [Catenulispora pinisilvae]|uniref:sensor histidine kinase n=1 Tax=Catenulispora pinisilvae TaxID=2705253 RepID=UPI001E3B3576|nr:HAMP domain-containing sensor histidine kinase [Catenulispora pinisilvae]